MSRLLAGSVATLLLTVSMPAFAQASSSAPAQPGTANGDDIIITAQKTEQRIEDVPLTVSAVTGQRMADIGVNSLAEVAMYVPGLRIQEQSANNPGIVIRGITSDSGSAQQGARVTLYYNGVDISRSRGAYQDLYDLERVEVVKGPQATLFGTAAAVGAVSIISAKPRAGFSDAITATYGNFNRTRCRSAARRRSARRGSVRRRRTRSRPDRCLPRSRRARAGSRLRRSRSSRTRRGSGRPRS